jgi:predicted Zn-dependent peptidase
MPEMNSVSLGIWIGTGSRYENGGNNGVSHFLEHLLFKGSRKRSGRKIKEDIEGVGGSLNGFTSEECTCYLAKVVSGKLGLALDVLADMVLHPLLRKEDIERERGVVREEISRQKDLPMQYVHVLFSQLMWGKHPLGLDICGTTDVVDSLTRKDISEYKAAFYKPANIVVAVAGKLEHDRIVEAVSGIFSSIPKSRRSKPSLLRKKQTRPQLVVEMRKTQQTHICLGTRALPHGHPDRYVLGILNIILGGNMSSRLFEEVREKRGLAYSIGSHVQKFVDTGVFLISAGIDSRRISDAIKVITKEMRKIREKEVLKKELLHAKEFCRGQILLSMEDTSNRMLWLGESKLALGRVPPIEEILGGIEKVTAHDLHRLSSELFRDDAMNLALIGPHEHTQVEKIFFGEMSH